jgi:predicted nucleic acid-binding protein
LTFVVDASVTMAWCFDDDATGYSVSVLKRLDIEDAITPSIWPLEVVNTLIVAERSKQFDHQRSAAFIRLLETLPVSVIDDQAADIFHSVATLAREQVISSYDASYVRLALREGAPLATIDGSMRGACQRLGVTLLS